MDEPSQAALERLATALESGGFVTRLALRQGVVPPQLRVELTPDAKDRVLTLELMFLPGISVVPVLQIYIGLPYEIEMSNLEELCRIVAAVNVHALVGAFGYFEARELLYYRCNVATDYEEIESRAVGWSMAMGTYLVETLGPVLEFAASGAPIAEVFTTLTRVVEADAALAAEQ